MFGKSLEEIEDEDHKEIVEIIRRLDNEYGLSDSLKNAIKIQKWCEKNYGDKPREERVLPSEGKGADEEEKELSSALKRIKNRVCKKYEGMELDEIDDTNHREVVEIIRYLDENYMSEEQKMQRMAAIKGKMQKAVGKQVAHNEETRKELEGPDKSLETEEEDVEK